MTVVELTLWLAGLLTGLGVVRLLTVEDHIARLVALNVTGAGTLLGLVGLSVRTGVVDAVPQALALTGIVITLAFTGVGVVLVRVVAGEETAPERPGGPAERPTDADGTR
jgi:multicomponent Na+:H+ antiporter subunit C